MSLPTPLLKILTPSVSRTTLALKKFDFDGGSNHDRGQKFWIWDQKIIVNIISTLNAIKAKSVRFNIFSTFASKF